MGVWKKTIQNQVLMENYGYGYYNLTIPGLAYPVNVTVDGSKSFCQLNASGVDERMSGRPNDTKCGIVNPEKCNQMMDYETFEYDILNQFKPGNHTPTPVIQGSYNTDYLNLRCSK
jgi:hypothetical protein